MSEPQDTQLAVFSSDTAFARALKLAETMATAKTLPAHLCGSPGDCLRVVELALRTNQSPFALADKTYLVKGKIGYEGQLCAALLNASPVLQTRLKYEYSGEGDALRCVVSATVKGEDEPRTIEVDWKTGHAQSPANKEIWKRQPEQQLSYWGARVWGRRHAPEVLMGIYTPEEIEKETMIRDVTPRERVVSDKPTLPPAAKGDREKEAEAPKGDTPWLAKDQRVSEEVLEALYESLDASEIEAGHFLAWINAVGKDTPTGGYEMLGDLPEDRVKAALNDWDKTSANARKWLEKSDLFEEAK